eukprot:TRINITY_DN35208_c0_g1_i1.p1 TRINITY_DN35208_c0_g1~~TRINITY_DN35208_c0_g1_i1.p1  ORF type:complete len:286 (-),score=24.74 TRINITY_DN35208_c0_g1_i1:213-1010(-)
MPKKQKPSKKKKQSDRAEVPKNASSAHVPRPDVEVLLPDAAFLGPVLVSNKIPTYKIVVVGDPGVGKTSLVARFAALAEYAPPQHAKSEGIGAEPGVLESTVAYRPTTLAQIVERVVRIHGHLVRLLCCDTGGELVAWLLDPRSVFAGAAASVIVYDVGRQSTFANVQSWHQFSRKHGDRELITTLVGNFCDRPSIEKVISAEDHKKAQAENGAVYAFRTTATERLDPLVNNAHVDPLLQTLVHIHQASSTLGGCLEVDILRRFT